MKTSSFGPYFEVGKSLAQVVTGLPRCKEHEYNRDKVIETLLDEDTRKVHVTLLFYVAEVCKRFYKRKKADHKRHERVMRAFELIDLHREWLMLGPKKQKKGDLLDYRIGVIEIVKRRLLNYKPKR